MKGKTNGCLQWCLLLSEAEVTDFHVCFWRRRGGVWRDRCERSCGGMRQRRYQFVEGFLCPISSVRGHVPRVLTLMTSLASSLPGDPGPGVFITYHYPQHPPYYQHTQTQISSWKKTNHPKLILSWGTCTNWMHIHTAMHDDPSVAWCLGIKHGLIQILVFSGELQHVLAPQMHFGSKIISYFCSDISETFMSEALFLLM